MGILGGNHTSPASAGNAATAAQSAKAHPANGIRPESAQPRPPARPPPAHDGIPGKAGAPPPFWRDLLTCPFADAPSLCAQVHGAKSIPEILAQLKTAEKNFE